MSQKFISYYVVVQWPKGLHLDDKEIDDDHLLDIVG
jgi:hypothetical protein